MASFILRLSPEVLQWIISFTELPQLCILDLHHDCKKEIEHLKRWHEYDASTHTGSYLRRQIRKLTSPLRLMLTCRKFYEVTLALLCGTNHFFSNLERSNRPDAVLQLSSSMITQLSSLVINLRMTTSLQPYFCDDYILPYNRTTFRSGPKTALNLSNDGDKRLITRWQSACEHIKSHATGLAPRLSLKLSSVVADMDAAQAVLQPLVTDRAFLRHCTIRLHCQHSRHLYALIESAVVHSTGRSLASAPSPFRFFDLPPEIRHRILMLTHLLAPTREVVWDSEYGMYLGSETNHENHLDYGKIEHGKVCGNTTTPTPLACFEGHDQFGCFCQTKRTACTSEVLPHCTSKCWRPLTALFLVNRRFRQESLQVFYGENRFTIGTGNTSADSWAPAPDVLPISQFLQQVLPKDALQYLRFVEIAIPNLALEACYSPCPSGSETLQDWLATLSQVQDKLDLPKLTIRVCFERCDPDYERDVNVDEVIWMLGYADLVRPLHVLNGLRRLFVHLPCFGEPTVPFNSSEAERQWLRQYRIGDSRPFFNVPALENALEQLVMGTDYDAVREGKLEVPLSSWHVRNIRQWHPNFDQFSDEE